MLDWQIELDIKQIEIKCADLMLAGLIYQYLSEADFISRTNYTKLY